MILEQAATIADNEGYSLVIKASVGVAPCPLGQPGRSPQPFLCRHELPHTPTGTNNWVTPVPPHLRGLIDAGIVRFCTFFRRRKVMSIGYFLSIFRLFQGSLLAF